MPSWGELLNELQPHKNENGKDVQGLTVDELREKYLKLLSQQTGTISKQNSLSYVFLQRVGIIPKKLKSLENAGLFGCGIAP